MRGNQKWLLLGLVTLLGVGSANAVTIGTNAGYTVNAIDFSIDDAVEVTDQDGPYTANSGDLVSFVQYGDGGGLAVSAQNAESPLDSEFLYDSFGQAFSYASESGNLFADAFLIAEDDVTDMAFHAESSWSNVYENTSGGDLDYDFDFFFSGGFLALGDNGGMAKFSLDILLDGNSIWDREVSLMGSPLAATVTYDADGLSHTFYQDPNYADLIIDPFSGSLDLGTFGAGDSFELTYIMEVWAVSEDQYSYVDVIAGDPFGVGFQGSVNNPIPEPTTIALLGMGLTGLALRRRHAHG